MTYIFSKEGIDHLRVALSTRPDTPGKRALDSVLKDLSDLVGDDKADNLASKHEAEIAKRKNLPAKPIEEKKLEARAGI